MLDSTRMTVFVGPSGSGKTTLLSVIGCMSRPTSGRIHLNGKETTSLPERFAAETRRTTFGFIFQNYNLIKGLSVLQLPTHHCPFCLLQKEYGYIGYPLYFSIFLAGITGAGVGVMDRFKEIPSLRETMPRSQKTLCLISMIGYSVFVILSMYPIVFSDFTLESH